MASMSNYHPSRLLTIVPLFAMGAVIASMIASTQFASAEHFESLFNGRDLEGWEGDPSLWSVEDGAITGTTTAENPIEHNTFLIFQGKPLGNFRLELQYRLAEGNSGIQYRSRVIDAEKWSVGGYQADIEAGIKYTGILYEEKGRGILALRGERATISAEGKREKETVADAADLQKHIRQNDWNDFLVEANGNRLRHSVNGHLMSETIDAETDAETEKRSAEGVLALQVHVGPPMKVQFRNIRLKRLAD